MLTARRRNARSLEDLRRQEGALREALEKAERHLRGTMPQNISAGLSCVEDFVAATNCRGYFGTLLSLLDCDDAYAVAVDAVAGNRFDVAFERSYDAACSTLSSTATRQQPI